MAIGEQVRLSLLLLAAVVVIVLSVCVLANTTPVIANHATRELALQRSTNGLYLFDNGYIDDGDYLLLGQLPYANYSRGGVYFIGASEMNTAIMTWTLPPDERRLIHNYAVGDMRHSDALQFVRMLERDGLLKAGGEKTTIILGLSYQMARALPERGGYLAGLFPRHGFYKYSPRQSIQRVQVSPLERFVHLERDRATRFLRFLILSPSRVSSKPERVELKIAHLNFVMSGNWRAAMEAEVAQLAALIDHLQQQKVHVRAILHPNGSWQAGLPYDAAYRELVMPLLQSRGVPVADLSRLLSDDEFWDAMHALYSGQVKLHEVYRALALQSLADMGTRIEP